MGYLKSRFKVSYRVSFWDFTSSFFRHPTKIFFGIAPVLPSGIPSGGDESIPRNLKSTNLKYQMTNCTEKLVVTNRSTSQRVCGMIFDSLCFKKIKVWLRSTITFRYFIRDLIRDAPRNSFRDYSGNSSLGVLSGISPGIHTKIRTGIPPVSSSEVPSKMELQLLGEFLGKIQIVIFQWSARSFQGKCW